MSATNGRAATTVVSRPDTIFVADCALNINDHAVNHSFTGTKMSQVYSTQGAMLSSKD